MSMVQGQPGDRVPDQSGIYNETLSKTQTKKQISIPGRWSWEEEWKQALLTGGGSPHGSVSLSAHHSASGPGCLMLLPDPACMVTSQSVHAWYFSLAFPKSQIAKNLSNILTWSRPLEPWKHSETRWWYAWTTLRMYLWSLSWGPEDGLEG